MIHALHSPRCQWCNQKLALKLEGLLVMYCPKCKKPNTFDTRDLTESAAQGTMQPVKEATG